MQPGTTLRFEASGPGPSNTITRNADPTIDTGAEHGHDLGVTRFGKPRQDRLGNAHSVGCDLCASDRRQAGTLTGHRLDRIERHGGIQRDPRRLGDRRPVAKSGRDRAGVLAPFDANRQRRRILRRRVDLRRQRQRRRPERQAVTTGATTSRGNGAGDGWDLCASDPVHPHHGGGRGLRNVQRAHGPPARLPVASAELRRRRRLSGFSKTAPSSTPLFASIAQTPNQSAIALGQAQPPGSPLYDAIIGQTGAGGDGFDALSGEIHASAVSAALTISACRAKR